MSRASDNPREKLRILAKELAFKEYQEVLSCLKSNVKRWGVDSFVGKELEAHVTNKNKILRDSEQLIYMEFLIGKRSTGEPVQRYIPSDEYKPSNEVEYSDEYDEPSDNKERLVDIVNAIASSDGLRQRKKIFAVARVNTIADNKTVNYWFLPSTINLLDEKELRSLGHFVPKNSYVAIQIQTNELGTTFEYDQINGIKRYEHHSIYLENRANLEDKIITLAGDNTLYQYRDIHEFLEALQENDEEIIQVKAQIYSLQNKIEQLKLQSGTAIERGLLTKEIGKLNQKIRILTAQQEDLRNITIYIRKQGEIRHTHIIDTIQTRIMSQNLFDGKTIIIDGGPGTGKTTTMIHRLGYLTDTYAIEEDEKYHRYRLNNFQRRNLLDAINNQRDWMFFSPSQMLKDYLADAMVNEGTKSPKITKNVGAKKWVYNN